MDMFCHFNICPIAFLGFAAASDLSLNIWGDYYGSLVLQILSRESLAQPNFVYDSIKYLNFRRSSGISLASK